MLLVWLPLNGNLNNQGVTGGSAVPTSTSYSFVDGQCGKCITASSSTRVYCKVDTKNYVSQITASNQFSMGAWVKTTATSNYIFNIGNADNTSNGNTRGLWMSTDGKFQWAYTGSGQNAVSKAINDDIWHHIFFTVNDREVKTYLDGVLDTTITASRYSQITEFEFASIVLYNNVFINDFRLYDECLSAKQVKKISKGLILHYPFNDPAPSYRNMITAPGIKSASYSWTASSGKYLYSIPSVDVTPGKTYMFSCEIMSTTSGILGSIDTNVYDRGTTYTGNDAAQTVLKSFSSTALVANKWTKAYVISTIKPDATNPYCQHGVVFNYSGTASATCYVRNQMLTEANMYIPFHPGTAPAKIYDISGMNNNADIVNPLTFEQDTAYKKYSYVVQGNNTQRLTSALNWRPNNFTVSCWMKTQASKGGTVMRNSTKYSPIFDFQGGTNIMRVFTWTDANNYIMYNHTCNNNKWVHYAYTYDGTAYKFYEDGVLKNSQNGTAPYSSGNLMILDYGGTTLSGASISDFRIYATALTQDEIKELYSATNTFSEYYDYAISEGMAMKTLPDGSVWTRLFFHHNHGGTVLFTSKAEVLRTSTVDKFSRLDITDRFKGSKTKFEFMLCYPEDTDAYNRWKQTNNPCDEYVTTGDGSANAEGYEAVSIAWTSSYWGGLTRQNSSPDSIGSCYLSGSVGHGNWFYAVGASAIHQTGIPSYGSSTAKVVELWVRIDDLT